MKRILSYYLNQVLVVLTVLLSTLHINSQNVVFKAITDHNRVALNSTLIIEFRLENAEGKDFRMPDVHPFKIVGGPATSTSLSIINGARSSSTSYQYSLLATKTGKFTIPGATIKVGGKIISCNPLIIEVTEERKWNDKAENKDNNLTFVRMEASEKLLYRGQQLIVDFVLYTRQNVESFNILKEPEFDGFYANPVSDLRSQPIRQTIGDKEYLSQILRRVILYPQKTGKFIIDPAIFEMSIPIEGSGGGFFFRRDIKREQIATNTLNLEVKDLPANIPSSFSGAVGDFKMRVSVNKNTCKVNDAIMVRLDIEGDGDPKLVLAPVLDIPENVETYQPNTVKDEVYYSNGKNFISKSFEYILVPKSEGIITLTPAFSYFSPSSGRFEIIDEGEFVISVVKQDIAGSPELEKPSESDISGISEVANLKTAKRGFFGGWWYFISLTIIFSTIIGMIFRYRKMQELENMDPVLKKKIMASKVATERLSYALEAKNIGEAKSFFDEISKAITGYLKAKYNIPNTQIQMHQLIDILEGSGVNPHHAQSVHQLLLKCEMAVFGGLGISMDNVYEEAVQLISSIEEC